MRNSNPDGSVVCVPRRSWLAPGADSEQRLSSELPSLLGLGQHLESIQCSNPGKRLLRITSRLLESWISPGENGKSSKGKARTGRRQPSNSDTDRWLLLLQGLTPTNKGCRGFQWKGTDCTGDSVDGTCTCNETNLFLVCMPFAPRPISTPVAPPRQFGSAASIVQSIQCSKVSAVLPALCVLPGGLALPRSAQPQCRLPPPVKHCASLNQTRRLASN